ncbi:MAG TPA: S1C family serine protease [Acidimicrobiales bacterium]
MGAAQAPPPPGFDPTGPQPAVGAGAPTPPAGTWPSPPQSAWGPGYGAQGVPSYLGWPAADPGAAAGPSAPSSKRRGLAMALATVALVVAVVAGVGLGHAVWPTSSATSSASANPGSAGSGSLGNGSNGGSSPFGNGSSGNGSTGGGSSPFGSGSSGNTSTGAGAPSDISAIAAKVDPALVDINTNLSYQNEQAAGTGMVLTSNGVILTNNHVIDGATSISVTDVGNGKSYSASVVGYDRTGDVAVIKLSGASGLQTVTTSPGTAAVGQAIVGVGNAGGTGGTPSTAGGSITALDQSITASDDGGGNAENLSGLIEVNAGIQPGDSGGSLVNTQGQVIGMDTAASAGSNYQVSATQAYAIPIETALSIAKKIESGQASSTIHIGPTGFLGVGVGSSSGSSGSGLGGGFGNGNGNGNGTGNSASSGAVVSQVLSGSAAGQAGVAVGDTITSLNGSPVSSPSDLSNLIEPQHPGDTVQLQWTDQSGQTHSASVKLGSGPPA